MSNRRRQERSKARKTRKEGLHETGRIEVFHQGRRPTCERVSRLRRNDMDSGRFRRFYRLCLGTAFGNLIHTGFGRSGRRASRSSRKRGVDGDWFRAMEFGVQKSGYRALVMIASPLLALALGGVGWASICNPGCIPATDPRCGVTLSCPACGPGGALTFLELDGNVGFDNRAGQFFDWAFSGANRNGCLTSPNQTTPITCCPTPPCSGGIFDGGQFVNATTPPKSATETAPARANTSTVTATSDVNPMRGDSTAPGENL